MNVIPWPYAVEGTGEDRVLDLGREKRTPNGSQEGLLAGEKKSGGRDTKRSPCPKLYLEGSRICLSVSE